PRSGLPSRFGEEVLLRVDQALGEVVELIEPVRPPEPMHVERLLSGPTTNLEGLMLATRELLGLLLEQLHGRESGARELKLTLARSDTTPLTLVIKLTRASRDAKHLWSLLRPRL